MGLRARLFLLVVIAVLPALAIQVYTEFDLRRHREAEIHDQALHQAQTIATAILEVLEGSRQLLIALARLPAVQSPSRESCSSVLEAILAELPAYSTIGAVNPDGSVICGSAGAATVLPRVDDRTYLHDALRTNGFVIGRFIAGRTTGTDILPVAQPIHRSGETVGILVAGLDLHWLAAHLRRQQRSSPSVLMVTDSNGIIIASLPESSERWVGRRLPEAHQPYVFGDRSQTVELKDMDGKKRVFAYIPIEYPPVGLAIAVGLAKREVLAPIKTAMVRSLALVLSGLVIGLIGAWLMGRYFVARPVAALLDATHRWQVGDYGARATLKDRSSEIGRLGHAFDEMAERLQRQLHQKDLLLREVNHRVMNSLQLLSSVLWLQYRRISDPEARTQFEQARRRIQSLALVHRRLYLCDTSDVVDFGRFLEELCADATNTLGSEERPMPVEVIADPIEISTDKAIPLALIIYELLTNAFKYAPPRPGTRGLKVTAVSGQDGTLSVSVSDNGPGLPPDFEQRAGLGVKLVQTLLAQLRGSLGIASSPEGTTVTVTIPLKQVAVRSAKEPHNG